MTIQYNTSTVNYNTDTFTYVGGLSSASANLPVLGVFIAFTSGAYDLNPNWVEVTQYVRQVSMNRGRTDELEQFQGGKATVVLDNRTRLFDPFNTAGTYYGNLKPRKQIKIIAQWAGVQYPMFKGYVSGFPVEWTEAGKDSTVTVDCFDLMAFMGAENLGQDWVVEYLQELGAENIIRNDVKQNTYITEDAELVMQYSTQPNFGSSGGSNLIGEQLVYKPAPVTTGNVSVSEAVMGLGSPRGFATTGDGYTFIELVRPRTITFDGSFSYVLWVKVDSSVSGLDSNDGVIDILTSENVDRFGLNLVAKVSVCFNQLISETLGSILVTVIRTGATDYVKTNIAINDSQPHCVVVSYDFTEGGWQIYVDGRMVMTPVVRYTQSVRPIRADLSNIGTEQTLNWGYAAHIDKALTLDEAVTLARLGSNSFIEPSDERFIRLINASNISSDLLDIDDAFQFFDVDALPQQGSPLLPALQQVANSEGSVMFVDAAGILHFWSRNTIFANTKSATSQVTFADDGTGFPYANRTLQVTLDGDQIRNEVTVQDSADRLVTARNTDSIAENGVSAESINTVLVDIDSSTELAQRIVNLFAEPDIDIEPFTLQGQYDTSYWDDLLGLDLLHRFTFKRTPSVGSAIVKQMLVQQVTWNMTPSTWECTIKGSARYTGWFTVGLSLVGGSDVVL